MGDSSAESPGDALARLSDVLARHGVLDFAVTGSVALGVWAAPRETRDIDLCGTLPLHEVDRLLAQRDGIRSGTGELPDLVRFRLGSWDIDLFVSKSGHDEECLRRAVSVEASGVRVRVVTPEDLLVHKMRKLRTDRRRILQDVADLRALLTARGDAVDWTYVRRWVDRKEADLLESLRTLDDENVLRRLLPP